jgi:hypothetical protein
LGNLWDRDLFENLGIEKPLILKGIRMGDRELD